MRLVGKRIPPPKFKKNDIVRCYYNNYILCVVTSNYLQDGHIYILKIIGEARTGVTVFMGWTIDYNEEKLYKV
jgi:hypothetical protein